MKVLRWIGVGLVIIGIGGFFTVADDLRHKGELIGVSLIVLSGLVLLGLSLRRNSKL